jgi:hypothetical protein
MKIIDQTPFFDHDSGEISMLDRGKALMKFGATWFKEVEAQNQVLAVMSKVLDRNYTLLRNILLTELGATFPFILVGPTGIFVMYVTPLTGMYRARGDQWGTPAGNLVKEESPNLLTRTERMARAVQIYLQRHGYHELSSVEAILLCSEPGMNVDSLRPIIRVVMRDALERFLISITQSRVVLTQETAYKVVEWLVNPSNPTPTEPEAPAPAAFEPETPDQEEVPGFQTFSPMEPQPPMWDRDQTLASSESPAQARENEPGPVVSPEPQPPASVRKPKRAGLTKGQWGFLIAIFVIWCLLISIFLAFVVRDQFSSLMSLLP